MNLICKRVEFYLSKQVNMICKENRVKFTNLLT